MPFGTNQFCVWHIPKSGGTWLKNSMNASGIPARHIGQVHATVEEHETHFFGVGIDNYQRKNFYVDCLHAVIIRDPIDWYSSVWRWMRNHTARTPLIEWFPSLEKGDLEDFPRFLVRNVGSYTEAVKAYSPSGCIHIRTEYMAQDATAWLRAIGVDFNDDLLWRHPRENVAEEKPPYVSMVLADMIRRTENGQS